MQSISTGLWSHGIEAAVLAHLGRKREATAVLAQPNFSTEFVREVSPFKVADHREWFIDGLYKAGLSELNLLHFRFCRRRRSTSPVSDGSGLGPDRHTAVAMISDRNV